MKKDEFKPSPTGLWCAKCHEPIIYSEDGKYLVCPKCAEVRGEQS